MNYRLTGFVALGTGSGLGGSSPNQGGQCWWGRGSETGIR